MLPSGTHTVEEKGTPMLTEKPSIIRGSGLTRERDLRHIILPRQRLTPTAHSSVRPSSSSFSNRILEGQKQSQRELTVRKKLLPRETPKHWQPPLRFNNLVALLWPRVHMILCSYLSSVAIDHFI